MTRLSADVAIIGAGFGGSLTALLTARIGLRTVLIERDSHPRFAIGESSTPQGDLVLAELADRYDLPRLKPLAKYGPWRRAYPSITCGLKRGFSYFHHRAGEPFAPRDDHANELLVTASPDEERADTHWLRSDFDAFLVREAQATGIPYFDRTVLARIEPGDVWRLEARRDGDCIEIDARFVVDASGGAGVLRSALGIEENVRTFRTNSRSIYAHFTGVVPWGDLYAGLGGRIGDHPFPCHAAALHHVFDGGWMYVLHFDNGVTSAGFLLDCDRHPLDPSVSPENEWNHLINRFPSIAEQFANAEPLMPLVRTDRLQRLSSRIAGANWAMLPNAAGFIDPLHSTGNAQTLCGVERLVSALQTDEHDRRAALERYERTTLREFGLIDRIIHGCYAGFGRFELMAAYSMFYFAGAHYSEQVRREGRTEASAAFLNAHDPRFRDAVERKHDLICELSARPGVNPEVIRAFENEVTREIEPYNLAGLCDRSKRNMYNCL